MIREFLLTTTFLSMFLQSNKMSQNDGSSEPMFKCDAHDNLPAPYVTFNPDMLESARWYVSLTFDKQCSFPCSLRTSSLLTFVLFLTLLSLQDPS